MLNRSMIESNADAPDDFRELLLAQLRWTHAMLEDYIKLEGRGYGEGQMPHEWGSIDTVDYMMSALQLSHDFLNEGVLGDPKGFLQNLGSTWPDDNPDDPMNYVEANYACDGVAPEVYTHFRPEEVGDEA